MVCCATWVFMFAAAVRHSEQIMILYALRVIDRRIVIRSIYLNLVRVPGTTRGRWFPHT